jgi:hypothetical protein
MRLATARGWIQLCAMLGAIALCGCSSDEDDRLDLAGAWVLTLSQTGAGCFFDLGGQPAELPVSVTQSGQQFSFVATVFFDVRLNGTIDGKSVSLEGTRTATAPGTACQITVAGEGSGSGSSTRLTGTLRITTTPNAATCANTQVCTETYQFTMTR